MLPAPRGFVAGGTVSCKRWAVPHFFISEAPVVRRVGQRAIPAPRHSCLNLAVDTPRTAAASGAVRCISSWMRFATAACCTCCCKLAPRPPWRLPDRLLRPELLGAAPLRLLRLLRLERLLVVSSSLSSLSTALQGGWEAGRRQGLVCAQWVKTGVLAWAQDACHFCCMRKDRHATHTSTQLPSTPQHLHTPRPAPSCSHVLLVLVRL